MADWQPFLSACIGGAFVFAGGWLGQRFQTQRDREARLSERQAGEAAARAAFERDTISHLMDGFPQLAAVVNSIHYERMQQWGANGRWVTVEDMGRRGDYTVAELEVMRFVDRPLQRELPGLGWEAILRSRSVVNAPSEPEASAAIDEMSNSIAKCFRALGERLRSLYGED